jgi:diphthine-ammonia ligase
MSKVAVCWTGGKDSSLAFHEAAKLGYKVDRLVTFAPSQSMFLAHPLDFIRLQANALGLPHSILDVAEPFDLGYETAITTLKERHGIGTLVTGDIAEVAGHGQDWMVERARRCDVDLIRPLWHRDRAELLRRVLEIKLKVLFSCVKKPWFTDDWLGRELNMVAVERLIEMGSHMGLDVCGEQGEYHTLVLDGPRFRKRIRVDSYFKRSADSVSYLALESFSLEGKPAADPADELV